MDIHSSFKGRSVVLGALVLVCLAPLFASSKIPARLPDRRAIQDPIQATASAQASAPLTTERIVSKPPQITYDDGQLTIVAENSRLSEVMSALRAAMGADIDLPASVAGQRIWVRLGPGPARSVLRDLLDNTELDYVIQASDTDLEGIRSLSLTVRSKTAEQGVPGSRVARGTSRRELPVSSNPVEAPEQDGSTPAESAAVSDAAPAGSPSTSTGVESAASQLQSAPVAPDPSLSRPGSGTSEQMIQQLQSMYEQRRQLQMQQNQKPPSHN
jgi:hypothetical protein